MLKELKVNHFLIYKIAHEIPSLVLSFFNNMI